jgi:hypothetical protein
MEAVPAFRAPKRRKLAKPSLAQEPFVQGGFHDSDAEARSASDNPDTIQTTLRRPLKPARPGVSFSSRAQRHDEENNGVALVPVEDTRDKLRQMTNRFTGTTGQVVDVDKHM